MIASALHHFLTRHHSEMVTKKQLRLFSDSCYGQSKNFNVMSMLLADRKRYFSQTDVLYTFPVRIHSYLPADRAFRRVAQDVKKLETITLPENYISILQRHGQVLEYNKDWQAFYYKAETSRFVKQKRELNISSVKRIQICGSGDKLSVSDAYNGDLTVHGVLKKGKSWANFRPPILENASTVKAAKKADVYKLLEEMGASDTVIERYQNMLSVGASDARKSDSDSE
ncbi:4-diphosphocytidyl-2-C-methyl-D-erythritol kinase [Elysia marginata]|uniref:4-diphosphocytidyl-2-C-methyl-D-erythritol kinase n=1 Tax=Elysia marginata TaxID=1093978 RepID=A0AAV4JIC5_9GAST|nr:4-diphosphocytidyl-2-C-methyl-D-erythritol kinase [Elysia marginata]